MLMLAVFVQPGAKYAPLFTSSFLLTSIFLYLHKRICGKGLVDWWVLWRKGFRLLRVSAI